MIKTILTAFAGAFLLAGTLPATPLIYLGTLGNGVPFVSGYVVGDGSGNCGLCGHQDMNVTDVLDFYKLEITGLLSQTITITGTRLDDNLDLAFVIFSGLLPEFPATPLDSSLRNGKKIWQDGSPLGLIVLAVGDDEINRSPFPFGDPRVTITLAPGTYTIAVSGGTGSGILSPGTPENYFLSLDAGTLNVDTPEPSSYLLIFTGLAGMAAAARRRKSL
jgi:PEP-CTERM motif